MEKNTIRLSDHFNFRRLLRFTLPSIIMMVFTSVYIIVDGFFVSNFVGKTQFAAVNFIMPILMILGCVGFMFGAGGSALIAKTMGEHNGKKANELFSLIVYTAIICGIALSLLGFIFISPIASLMGAKGALLKNSLTYCHVILISLPFFILQYEFQCLFATAGKPKLGLYITIASGVTNMFLDWLFVAVFGLGLTGTAAATALSQFIGGIVPLIYFGRKNSSCLQLVKCKFDGRSLIKTCLNGSSELMSNISASIVGMLFNIQLIKYAGVNGIAAYGVLMYVSMIFQAIFIGYSVGAAPIVGYNYGAQNHTQLKNLRKKGLTLISVFSVFMFLAGQILAKPLSLIFVSYDAELLKMTAHAFTIFSFSFLLSGFSIFGSSFFTALSDGLTSALISFFRTLVFQCAAVMLFPIFWNIDGIWISVVAAELMAAFVTFIFLIAKRKKYNY